MENNLIVKNEREAYEFCEDTRALKNKMEVAGLELGKRLWTIKENGFADNSQYGSFNLYLEDIKLKFETAKVLMRVYQTFCIKYSVPLNEVADAGGYSLLHTVLPIVKSREDAYKALTMVATYSRKHLKQEVQKELGLRETEECLHANMQTVTYQVCEDCNFRKKIA